MAAPAEVVRDGPPGRAHPARRGGDGAGPWAALAVLVALAIVGGAARHLIGDVAHVLVTVLEVIGWTLAAIASAAVAGGGVLAGVRIRRAVRAARARRAMTQPAAPVIQITPEGYVRPLPDEPGTARPALGPPPQGTCGGVAAARLVGGDPPADRG